MERLQPQPGDKISLFAEPFEFREHESATWMAYCAEGRRASVYRLQDARGMLWALKVFKPVFRDPSLKDQATLGARTKGVQGLRSCHRRVVLPTQRIVKLFPELKYAVLMPW